MRIISNRSRIMKLILSSRRGFTSQYLGIIETFPYYIGWISPRRNMKKLRTEKEKGKSRAKLVKQLEDTAD